MTAFTAPSILRRDVAVPLPAWPSSLDDLTAGMAALAATAPTVDGIGVNVIDAIHASGVHTLGAELIGSFPLPDMLSLRADLVQDLQQHLTNAIGAGSMPNAQALAYTQVVRELTERLADLEAQAG